ncbi:MAG: response regulator transcription factor [Xanthomonadales bacterium]|nr:response regulator transcription factor [Xanthomonadales bacterium]
MSHQVRRTADPHPAHLVLAEDDEFVQKLLAAYLEQAGFRISLAGTGRELLSTLDAGAVDVVLLDLGLPDEDGLVLMRQIRLRSTVPVIVLTARQEREDRISALELGVDDYLTKPCDPEELVLRVQNLLKRSSAEQTGTPTRGAEIKLHFGDWTLALDARTLTDGDGADVHLSRTEFNLLAALLQAPNRALSRGQLLDAICQHDESPSERMIDVVVARLRRKIEIDPANPEWIKTMVGVGYKFSGRVSRSAA